MRKYAIFWGAVLAALTVAGCSAAATPTPLLERPDAPPAPPLNAALAARGEALYAQYCAECHGPNGEGQPDWKIPNNDGTLKPPPHNNNGHTWHHPDDLLLDLIANGSGMPQTQMPKFGDTLSNEEIMAIIEFMKGWWGPDERAFQWQVTWQTRQLQTE